jgi:hypothetical protein
VKSEYKTKKVRAKIQPRSRILLKTCVFLFVLKNSRLKGMVPDQNFEI